MQRATVWSKTMRITYADFLLVDKHFHYFYDKIKFAIYHLCQDILIKENAAL